MKPIEIEAPSHWLRIFEMSRAYSRTYRGEELPAYNWEFPKGTWFRQRLAEVQAREATDGKAKAI